MQAVITPLVTARAGRVAPPARQAGFGYIGVLVMVALLGVALAAAGQVWQTAQRREREQELLFIGQQFRLALERYARNTPGKGRRAPLSLDELLEDPRHPDVRRYLRKIHVDPMTGRTDWGLVTGPSGEIHGVHSLSDAAPLKQAGFALADRRFENAAKYSEWVFMPN